MCYKIYIYLFIYLFLRKNWRMKKNINLAGACDWSPSGDLKQNIQILNFYECRYHLNLNY